MKRSRRLPFSWLLALVAISLGAQGVPDYEQPPVNYSATAPNDETTRLQQRLSAGGLVLDGAEQEILLTLLGELGIPVESQVVVFSKTSLQRRRIRPSQPRAIYFSDTAYVGWVPGGMIEVATIDPQLGPVFYTLDPHPARGGPRQFVRDSSCLSCHGGTFVRDVPGLFARSVVPSQTGEPLLRHGTELVDDRTPFADRWGGWYVTGYTGTLPHRGNAFATEKDDSLDFPLSEERPADLSGLFDTSRYPANTSDVVALLVLEHQMSVQNVLTRAAHICRKMLAYQRSLQTSFKEQVTDEPVYDSVKSVFRGAVDDVVDGLLFHGAAPLPEGVTGNEAFRRRFVQDAPRSRAGHSLKDLQLRDRIFSQRCSYLIYSDTFAALPPPLKSRILDRLYSVLRDDDPNARYAYLGKEERRRIQDILMETHPEAKARWQSLATDPSAQ